MCAVDASTIIKIGLVLMVHLLLFAGYAIDLDCRIAYTASATDADGPLDVDGIFVAIGHKPNTDLFINKLELDNEGYLKVNNQVFTNKKGVFAAGDVHDKTFRQAVTAAGFGCMAALEAEKFIESKK